MAVAFELKDFSDRQTRVLYKPVLETSVQLMASIMLTPRTPVTSETDIEMGQLEPVSTNSEHGTALPGRKPQVKNDWDPVPDLPTGYPKLAGFFACIPNAASFRRFNELNMRRLLYLPADLCDLEQDLLEVERNDAACTDESKRNRYATHWDAFKSSANSKGRAGKELSKQWDLMMGNVNPKLKEYS
jgi:hypothetical protein